MKEYCSPRKDSVHICLICRYCERLQREFPVVFEAEETHYATGGCGQKREDQVKKTDNQSQFT